MPVLTTAAVRKFKSTDKGREIPDTQSPGLRLMIYPKFVGADGKPRDGAKAWIMRFRRPDGRPCKLTLGRVHILEPNEKEPEDEPLVGAPLTLRAARQLAAQISRERARGVDVIAENAVQKSRKRAKAEDATANSFGKLVVQFFRDHKVKKWGTKPRRWRGDAAILGLRWDCDDPAAKDAQVIPGGLAERWIDKPLASIDGHDIHAVVDEARKLGIPGLGRRNRGVSENRGRKMHSGLSNFFRWAQRQRKVPVNPVQGVWHPGAPPARERVLNDAEIKAFWLATEKVAEPVRSLLRVLLLTGQRVNEVKGMRREELAPDGAWVIPGSRTKNHRANTLILPSFVGEIIAGVPRIEGSPFLFTGSTGKTPVTIGSKVKQQLVEAMGTDMPDWRMHDLRRTVASGLLRLGVRSEAVERLLNHTSGNFRGIVAVYQVDPLTAEVTSALERWSQHVAGLLEGGDKVVPIRKKGKR